MKAFHNDSKLADLLVSRVRNHMLADEIVKGRYWESGKGCAVGCSLHSSNHMSGETEFGIPVMLWRLEDSIFERLQNELAKKFPLRFAEACASRVGDDLSGVGWKFLHWLISQELAPFHMHNIVGSAIKSCADILKTRALGVFIRSDAAYAAGVAYAAYAAGAADGAGGAARQADKLINIIEGTHE